MKKKHFSITAIVLFFLITGISFPQTGDGSAVFRSGLRLFGEMEYENALRDFREIVINPGFEAFHGAAYYWIGRSYLAMNDLQNSERNIEFFLHSYPDHILYPDGLYQKGRLLFLQKDYENSIEVLYSFLEQYKTHSLASSAYFWIGESLFSLGHFDEAKQIFSFITRIYPASVKYEAADFRLMIVDLKERERELIKLLKMSHEEYLKALEEFQRRERNYDQVINSLQRKLTAASSDDPGDLFNQLNAEITAKEEEIAALKRRVEYLEESRTIREEAQVTVQPETAAAPERSPVPVSEEKALLRLKEESLALKEYYLEILAKELGTLE